MFINRSSKEINVKLIYVGPPCSQKAENLQYIYDKTDADSKGKMISIATGTESTIFFDLAPKTLGEIRGFRIRIHLYTLEGTEERDDSTRLLLKNADGIVFVADCRRERLEASVRALTLAKSVVREQGFDWSEFPRVIQRIAHAATDALPAAETRRALGLTDEPMIDADTQSGHGVFDTLKAGVKALLLAIKDDRLREWNPTAEEIVSQDRMTSRVQVVSHYGEFFGEDVLEYGPWQPSPRGAPFYVMLHRPTDARPYFTYATFGVSSTAQPSGGPDPRIELVAYSPVENTTVAERLAIVATMIKAATADDAPFKVFDTIEIGDKTRRDCRFALVPPDEPEEFLRFPDQTRKVRDLLFTSAVGAATDADARVTFLQLLPLTPDEADYATARSTRALLEAFASRPKHFGWGRTPEQSVLRQPD